MDRRKVASVFLTAFGVVGVAATAVLAAKATPKALEAVQKKSREEHNGDPNAATLKEKVQAGWKYYIPASVVGGTTVLCIFGMQWLSKKEKAALLAASAYASKALKDYKDTVRELYGEEANQEVEDRLREGPPNYTPTVSCPQIDFEEDDEEEHMFYDSLSQRYFTSTFDKVRLAEYLVNRRFALSGECSVNDYFKFLGLEPIDKFEHYIWSVSDDEIYWIDFDHTKADIDDGPNATAVCWIIYTPYEPTIPD